MGIIGVHCEECGARIPERIRIYEPELSRFYCPDCYLGAVTEEDPEPPRYMPLNYGTARSSRQRKVHTFPRIPVTIGDGRSAGRGNAERIPKRELLTV